MASYLIKELLDGNGAQYLKNFNFHILPVVNPDGYEFSRTDERYWRKSRSTIPFIPECVGVDLNRNWDYKFKSELMICNLQCISKFQRLAISFNLPNCNFFEKQRMRLPVGIISFGIFSLTFSHLNHYNPLLPLCLKFAYLTLLLPQAPQKI